MAKLTEAQIREAARIYGSRGGRPKGYRMSQEAKDRIGAASREYWATRRAEQAEAEQEKEAS